jgi:hypothetical protein
LHIYWQDGWTNPNGDAHSNLRSGWNGYRQ